MTCRTVLTFLSSLPKRFNTFKGIIKARMSGSEKCFICRRKNVMPDGEEEMDELRVYNASSSERKCYSCNRWEHISSRFPDFTNRKGRELCSKCKSAEHFERNCPMNRDNLRDIK